MKINKRDTQEGFRPVILEITFETKAELKTMWNLLNVSDAAISEASQDGFHPIEVVEVADFQRLFDVLCGELREDYWMGL